MNESVPCTHLPESIQMYLNHSNHSLSIAKSYGGIWMNDTQQSWSLMAHSMVSIISLTVAMKETSVFVLLQIMKVNIAPDALLVNTSHIHAGQLMCGYMF